MRLIRSLGRRESKTGNSYCSWGLFFCPSCENEVEKQLGNGKICKSCGCARDENISKARKGKYEGKNHPMYGVHRYGKDSPNWKGGEYKSMGYIYLLKPSHHRANYWGYVKRCDLVMEKKKGRDLSPGEVVHHKNKIKDDDRPENLRLFSSNSKHISYHHRQRKKINYETKLENTAGSATAKRV